MYTILCLVHNQANPIFLDHCRESDSGGTEMKMEKEMNKKPVPSGKKKKVVKKKVVKKKVENKKYKSRK